MLFNEQTVTEAISQIGARELLDKITENIAKAEIFIVNRTEDGFTGHRLISLLNRGVSKEFILENFHHAQVHQPVYFGRGFWENNASDVILPLEKSDVAKVIDSFYLVKDKNVSSVERRNRF